MTEQQYKDNLRRLAEISPDHALLPRLRKMGYSRPNALYLAQCLKSAGKERAEEQRFDFEDVEGDDPTGDETLKQMRVKLRQLFFERVQLSDRFHELKTVEDRAFNSEEIQIVQRNIGAMMERIRHYRAHGTLPENDSGGFYVSRDGFELARQRQSLRSGISIKRKALAQMRETNPTDPVTLRKMEKIESKLMDMRSHLKRIDEAIANL